MDLDYPSLFSVGVYLPNTWYFIIHDLTYFSQEIATEQTHFDLNSDITCHSMLPFSYLFIVKRSFGQYETSNSSFILEILLQYIMIYNQISSREREVLDLIAYQYSHKEIASQLYISTHTVRSHRKILLKKLSAINTADLIRRALEENIISLKT